jgi:phosphoglycolate phosphatase-like HAD superfamily hydrolase
MLEQAAKDFNLNLEKCWMIGDTPSDMQAGKNAGCKTIQVLTGKYKIISDYADFLADDLFHASSFLSQ